MPLTPGTRLGPYEIVAALGAGGMGEVYRARDTRLGRDVAVKVISPDVAADPDRLARFNEEARATAALNHPNILVVHDVGTDGGITYLVSEVLEGRTLRDLLNNETMTISRVVDVAGQLADGLAAAHARGIIHRDLKPENVFLTTDGRAKILDFGLAKVVDPDVSPADAHTRAATAAFTVLGSVGYMSPEQVRAQPADHRSDLFAFGCVLYEMLSGRRAFTGETVHDSMSAILRDAPAPLESSPARPFSPLLLSIVDRCLEKSPAARFQSTPDLAFALKGVTSTHFTVPSGTDVGTVARGVGRSIAWRTVLPWAISAVAVITAVTVLLLRPSVADPPRRLIRLVISGGDQPFRTGTNWEQFAMSADGSRVVYSLVPPGTSAGGVQGASGPLYMRRLDQPEAKPIPGTEGAIRPILSPDGQWLVFTDTSNSVVKRIPVEGGTAVVLADNLLVGGTWASDGSLVLGKTGAGLVRLPSSGGSVTEVLAPSERGVNYSHPQVLPDGSVIFTIIKADRRHTVGILPAGAKVHRELVDGMHPRFIPPGYLIFARASTLWAATFDPKRLEMTGEPVPVLQDVLADQSGGQSNFTVSTDGSIAFIPGGAIGGLGPSTFAMLNRTGTGEVVLPFRPQQYGSGLLSPDGKSLLAAVQTGQAGFTLSLGDVGRGTLAQVSDQPVSDYAWSTDGRRIEYRRMDGEIWARSSDLSAPEIRVFAGRDLSVNDAGLASRDGKTRVITATGRDAKTGADIWLINPPGNVAATPWLQSPSNDTAISFSPDGRWLLYASQNPAAVPPNRNDLYIQPFPGPGAVSTVTRDGAGLPARWIGQDIIFRQLGGGTTTTLLVARVTAEPRLAVELPRPLFQVQSSYRWDDVTRDGQVFLFRKDESASTGRPSATELHVIVNWIDDVKQRLNVARSAQ